MRKIIINCLIASLMLMVCNYSYGITKSEFNASESKMEIMNESSSPITLTNLTCYKNGSNVSVKINYTDHTNGSIDFIAFGVIWLDKWGEPTTNYKDCENNSILAWHSSNKTDSGKWINVANGDKIKGFRVPLIEIHYKNGTYRIIREYEIGGKTNSGGFY